ncbi:MAG: putative S-methyl-5-thioinosine phosphorylase [Actinomycetota bacterium]|jgi:5'-methylthioinosine phosphorylase|nr:putative S-methyl-5-thioinosine phosphorylase [Actinomycetota bacterium]
MGLLGVIGGSGLYGLDDQTGSAEAGLADTPWGPTSGPLVTSASGGGIAFIARHGVDHSIAPHRVNYRANIHALREAGCDRILAVASVGGMRPQCVPGALVVPDQLVDYTWGREMTFHEESDPVVHPDFTDPYSPRWRGDVIDRLHGLGFDFIDGGTYAAVQGPRFETAAEIRRLAGDGCDIVGMTGMPEAILAREAGLDYAAVCPVGNLAAGISPDELEMGKVIAAVGPVMERVTALIADLA